MTKLIAVMTLFALAGCASKNDLTLTVEPGGSMTHCNVEHWLDGGWSMHNCQFDRADLIQSMVRKYEN